MDQLTRQLDARLEDIASSHELVITHGLFVGDPGAAVGDAKDALEIVRRSAGALEASLRYAQNSLSAIAVRIPDDE